MNGKMKKETKRKRTKRFGSLFLAGALTLTSVGLTNIPATKVNAASDVTESINVGTISAKTDNIGYEVNDYGVKTLTVKNDGIYEFTGSASNVAIAVKKSTTATLVLNNLTIDDSSLDDTAYETDDSEDTEATEAIIAAKKYSKVTIELAGTNTLTGNTANEYLEDALKHGKEDDASKLGGYLTITGSGTLNIRNTSGDAIKYKSETNAGGYVNIAGGTINITNCYGDGIQAENVNISGGNTTIQTTYANASTGYYTSGSSSTTLNTISESGSTKTERVNVDTGSHKGIKAGTKGKICKYSDGTATTTTTASGGFTMTGGTLTIDTTAAGLKANSVSTSGYTATATGVYIIGSPDDAIHSNNTISVTGGTLNLATGDDAITAAGAVNITGTPTVNITTAYEGIEGKAITIGTSGASAGPDVSIIANDDGINAASKTLTYTYASADNEDYNYTKVSTSNSGNTCVIYSGNVTIKIDSTSKKTATLVGKTITYTASGDGIDCNGTLDIEGGTVNVFGQSSGDNSPLDTDNGFTLGSNATVLAAGCDAMGETTPESGSGVYVTYGSSGNMGGFGGNAGNGNFGGNMRLAGFGGNATGGMNSTAATISAGSTFSVKNGSTTIVSTTLPYAASFVLYASPSLTSGTSYTVTAGSNSSTVTAASAGSGNQNNNQNGVPEMLNSRNGQGDANTNTNGNTGTGSQGGTGSGANANAETASENSAGSASENMENATATETVNETDATGETTDSTTETDDTATVIVEDNSTAANVVVSTSETVTTGTKVETTDKSGTDVSYTVSGAKTVTYNVEDTDSDAKKIVVPNTVTINDTTYKVTKIANGALKGDTSVKTVKIGSNVKMIGKNAFRNCANLKTVTITSNVTSVRASAFKGIKNNAKITIQASGNKAFHKIVKKIANSGTGTVIYKYKKA